MGAEGPATRRIVAILLLMCALLCAQTASLTSENLHQHSSQHCCGLCHIGPLPFVQPEIASGIAPEQRVAWLEDTSGLDEPHDIVLTAGSSRAPPA